MVTEAELHTMSEAEIMANVLSDPDNPRLTRGDLARLMPLPKARALRIRLRLTREELAARYHIALGTLRDWEQRGASRRTHTLAPRGQNSSKT
jgi:putative transcriptional regulator